MATIEQNGGMRDVFILLKGKTLKETETSIKSIEKLGGHVTHVFPPDSLVASVPVVKLKSLERRTGVSAVIIDPVENNLLKKSEDQLLMAMNAWNHHIDNDRIAMSLESPLSDLSWGKENLLPPDPPKEILMELNKQDAEAFELMSKAPDGAPNYNIPVLVGRVAIGVIFVDSTVSQYAITSTEKTKVVSETVEGLNMLSSFEPRAGIQWFYDLKYPKINLPGSAFPASNKNGWEDTWRNAAMAALGYSANFDGMKRYINDIKTRFNAQWAFALFVTKYPKIWFGYYWANHIVMDFALDGWGIDRFNLVVAHETGHVFGCGDEYASSGCVCTSLHGRYQVKNGNCENCAPNSIPCLMKSNSQAICDFSRGQLGWNDLAIQSRGTTILKGTWTFDFDTGVQGPPTGADIWWEQVNNVTRYLVPRSGAMLSNMGKVDFEAVSRQTLAIQPYTATPINGSNNSQNKLLPGTVIAVKTNTGRYAKMRIDLYGYNLTITWVTFK